MTGNDKKLRDKIDKQIEERLEEINTLLNIAWTNDDYKGYIKLMKQWIKLIDWVYPYADEIYGETQ